MRARIEAHGAANYAYYGMDASTPAAPLRAPDGTTCCLPTCRRLVSAGDGSGGLCTSCRVACYCTRACQRADWPAHKPSCSRIVRRSENFVPTSLARPLAGLPGGLAEVLRAEADEGNATSQFQLGVLYSTGSSGLPQSHADAYAWCARSVAQGDAAPTGAHVYVGMMYEAGRGVAKDEGEAVRLYRVGAAKGDDNAVFRLATCLATGIGAAPDPVAACELWAAAAARGHIASMLSLASCALIGRGAALDVDRAKGLFERVLSDPRASVSDAAAAKVGLATVYVSRDATGACRDAVAARRLMEEAAAAGNVSALDALEMMSGRRR